MDVAVLSDDLCCGGAGRDEEIFRDGFAHLRSPKLETRNVFIFSDRVMLLVI
jgi:hypothetical protein